MPKDNKEVQEPDTPSGEALIEWDADPNLEAFDLAIAIEELGLNLSMQKAADLVDHTFLIIGAKQFPSTMSQENNPYYCRCFDEGQQEGFAVVLGGGQPVEILPSYIASGRVTPLRVTLRHVEGGVHGGYYILE